MSGRAGFNTPKRQSEPQIASEAFAQISCIISTLWEVPYRHGGEVPPEKTQVDDEERECVSSAVPRLDRLSCAPTCAFAVSFTSQLWESLRKSTSISTRNYEITQLAKSDVLMLYRYGGGFAIANAYPGRGERFKVTLC